MAIDITGIINENEFYTHHYLSAILENDLKDVFAAWNREERGGSREEKKSKSDPSFLLPPSSSLKDVSPPQKLNSLCKRYFSLRDKLERARDDESVRSLRHHYFAAIFADFHFNAPQHRKTYFPPDYQRHGRQRLPQSFLWYRHSHNILLFKRFFIQN